MLYTTNLKKFLVSLRQVMNNTLNKFTKRRNHTKHLSLQLDKSRLWLSKIKLKDKLCNTDMYKRNWDDYVYDLFRYWHLKLIPKKG